MCSHTLIHLLLCFFNFLWLWSSDQFTCISIRLFLYRWFYCYIDCFTYIYIYTYVCTYIYICMYVCIHISLVYSCSIRWLIYSHVHHLILIRWSIDLCTLILIIWFLYWSIFIILSYVLILIIWLLYIDQLYYFELFTYIDHLTLIC